MKHGFLFCRAGQSFFALACGLVLAAALAGCATQPATGPAVKSDDIQDYVCLVLAYRHPAWDVFLHDRIAEIMVGGNRDSDAVAATLEGARRGGGGSGFVYVDGQGNNYILTNYHVIEGSYRVSVVFEKNVRINGNDVPVRREYQNLSIHAVDEAADLAILAFPDGQKPYRQGLSFISSPLKAGDRVNAAGYPGLLGGIQQFSWTSGDVSNPRFIRPGSESEFIHHQASINSGNSGGPLLVAGKGSPVNYQVAGINTLTIRGREGGNLSIPAGRVQGFIDDALRRTNDPAADKAALDARIERFVSLLNKSQKGWVYRELSSLLSSTMFVANTNAVRDILLTDTLSNSQEVTAIRNRFVSEPLSGINWAVAYRQEILTMDSERLGRGEVNAELLSVAPNRFGGWTSRFLVRGHPFKAEWVKEYGDWLVDSFALDDGEFNDISSLATPHPLGKRITYTFASAYDFDWYVLEIPRAGRLTVFTEGQSDPAMLVCYNPEDEETRRATRIGFNDDISESNYNAWVSEMVRAGKVYVLVQYAQQALPAGYDARAYTLMAHLGGDQEPPPPTPAAAKSPNHCPEQHRANSNPAPDQSG